MKPLMEGVAEFRAKFDHAREQGLEPRLIKIDPNAMNFYNWTFDLLYPYRFDKATRTLTVWEDTWEQISLDAYMNFGFKGNLTSELTSIFGVPVEPYTPPTIHRGEE